MALQPRKALVNLLSRTQLFLLCIVRSFCATALRAPSVRFAVPQCLLASQQFERIVEARFERA